MKEDIKFESAPDGIEVVTHLTIEIGSRFGGSDGEHQASDYLQQTLTALGIETTRQGFTYTGWEMVEQPRLRIETPTEEELDVKPLLWSGSTDGEIRGELTRVGEKSLIPGLDGYELPLYSIGNNREAEIIACEEDHAIPLINPRPLYQRPQFIISQPDQQRLETLLAEHGTVEVAGSITTKREKKTSYNIIGHYRPDDAVNPDSRILVGAHYDTTINTSGAYDNASGVGAVVDIAEKVLANDLAVNIDFVFFACEENGILGSQEMVTRLREESRMNIDRAIVLDMMSGGEEFSIWVDPDEEEFSDDLVAGAKSADIDPDRIDLTAQKPGSDGWPFHDVGIPTTTLLWWKLNDIYHTEADTMDEFDEKKYTQSVECVYSVLEGEDAR
jgi:hypothetical protein